MRHYLPFAAGGNAIIGQSDLSMVTQFTVAWMALLGNKATAMVRDDRLAQAAQRQADWLAVHDFDRTDPHLGAGGMTANERVRATGYVLPVWYPTQGNQVESASHSWRDPATTARSLANHAPHSDHMHVTGWFSGHVVYGVGAAVNRIDLGGIFYVVVTAPREV